MIFLVKKEFEVIILLKFTGDDEEEYTFDRRQREQPQAGRLLRRGIVEGSFGTGMLNGRCIAVLWQAA